MSGRNNLVSYDPAVARQAAQAELRSKVAPKVLDCNKPGSAPIQISAEAQNRAHSALNMELDKVRRRMDERRRRDPTFREDAVDFDRSKILPFSKFRDYYAVSCRSQGRGCSRSLSGTAILARGHSWTCRRVAPTRALARLRFRSLALSSTALPTSSRTRTGSSRSSSIRCVPKGSARP